MPQKFGSLILDLGEITEDECKLIPLKCPWILTSKDESLTGIITCLKRTVDYDFCVGVAAHPQRAPIVSEQIDLDDHQPLLRCLTDAVNL